MLRAWSKGGVAAEVAALIHRGHYALKALAEEARAVLAKLSPQRPRDVECRQTLDAAITSACLEHPSLAALQQAEASLTRAMAASRAQLAAVKEAAAADQQRISQAQAAQAQREARQQAQRRLRFGRIADSTMIAVPLVIPALMIVTYLLPRFGLWRAYGYLAYFWSKVSLSGNLFLAIIPPASVLVASLLALSIRAQAEHSAWKRFPAIFKRCTIGPLKVMLSYLAASLVVGAVFLVVALILWLAGRESGFLDTWLKVGFWGAYLIAYGFAWRRCFQLQRGAS